MQDFYASLAEQATAWTLPEFVAVACAILYLLFAIRENIWCWLFAGISTMIYVWLFFSARLYMESLLNVFYFGMAIYGWWVWHNGRTDDNEMAITVWPLRIHIVAAATVIALALGVGTFLARFTDAAFPYIDSATTFAAIWATFLVARKVLENWWYWLAIDAVSIFIYWSRELELTSMLFVLYVAMIPFGLARWTRSYREATA